MSTNNNSNNQSNNINDSNSNNGNAVAKYFSELDKDFHNLKCIDDELFQYHAQDVLIQSHWELPLVISCPNSVVTYKFASSPGDLSFGIMFVPALEEGQSEEDLQVETLEQVLRTNSGDEMIEGELTLDIEGVLFFLWDNEFDWLANKYLSYSIQTNQPSFTLSDQTRCTTSQTNLRDVLVDIETASIRLADAEDFIVYHGHEVMLLENQIARLREDVARMNGDLIVANDEIDTSCKQLNFYFDTISGLCIRCLDAKLLTHVFSFLPFNGPHFQVCKFWRHVIAEPPLIPTLSLPVEATSKPPTSRVPINSDPTVPRTKPNLTVDVRATAPPHSNVGTRPVPRQRHHYSEEYFQANAKSLLAAVAGKPLRSPKSAQITPTGSTAGSIKRGVRADRRSRNIAEGKDTSNGVPATGISPKGSPATIQKQSDRVTSRAAAASVGLPQSMDAGKLLTNELNHHVAMESQPPADKLQSGGDSAVVSPTNPPADLDNLQAPRVAESKDRVRKPADFTRKKTAPHQNSRIPDWKEPGKGEWAADVLIDDGDEDVVVTGDMEMRMIKEVRKMRNDQQLASLIEYVQAGYAKIEDLESSKRKIKKLFRAWSVTFERNNGREPTTKDKKAAMKEQYQEYEELSVGIQQCREKVERVLRNAGLSYNDFVRLRDRRAAEWKYSVEAGKISLREFEALASPSKQAPPENSAAVAQSQPGTRR